MWPTIIAILIVLVIVLGVAWFVRIVMSGEPVEPRDEADLPARVGGRPRPSSGAVALEEPDEKEPPDVRGRKS
jgi:hypothetical protein